MPCTIYQEEVDMISPNRHLGFIYGNLIDLVYFDILYMVCIVYTMYNISKGIYIYFLIKQVYSIYTIISRLCCSFPLKINTIYYISQNLHHVIQSLEDLY